MVSSRTLIAAGSTVFGGLALAWILPPTTPIGGATVSALERRQAPLAEHPLPSPEMVLPEPAAYSATPDIGGEAPAPRLEPEKAVPTPRVAPAPEAEEEIAPEDDPQPSPRQLRRAFRIGYRVAQQDEVTSPDECDRFDERAAAEGCLAYLRDAEEPAPESDGPYR